MKRKKIEIHNLAELNNEIEAEVALALFFSSSECAVCHVDFPRVEALAEETDIPLVHIVADKVSEATGQMGVFTVPTVLLYLNQREYHRQSRFIDFRELRRRMEEIAQILTVYKF